VVSAPENLTALRVRVLAVGAHPRLAGWVLVSVRVLAAGPVEGRADLLSHRVGHRLELGVRGELLAGPGDGAEGMVGAVVSLRARLVVGEVLAEPHPLPGDFTVEREGGSGG
jgi:hypothetical protein